MAKRRNLKKEKALRNQEYARKFRRKRSSSRFGRGRFNRKPGQSAGAAEGQEESQDSNAGAAEGAE